MHNNLNLLRHIDLNTIKRGDIICWLDRIDWTAEYLGKANERGYNGNQNNICFMYQVDTYLCVKDQCVLHEAAYFRMVPLGWHQGKPVYKGDKLYVTVDCPDCTMYKKGSEFILDSLYEGPAGKSNTNYYVSLDYLSWDKPKVKKTGWINIHKDKTWRMSRYPTKEAALKATQGIEVIDTIQIEWYV